MCTNPKKAYFAGLTPEGRPKYKIVPHRSAEAERLGPAIIADYIRMEHSGDFDEFTTPLPLDTNLDWFIVPCGHCLECRIQKSKDWANRMMMEFPYHEKAYFLTLTYNDAHVPMSSYRDPGTGDYYPVQSLNYDDTKNWLKRLRKAFEKLYGSPVKFNKDDPSTWRDPRRISYYLCGEYGGKTFRPHYHCILFSPSIPDCDFASRCVGVSETGNRMFNSGWLDATWSDDKGEPIGFITYSEVSWATCAYVARYAVKKRYGAEPEFYAIHNIEEEKSRQSSKPALGFLYFQDHPDIFDYKYITMGTEDEGLKFLPPRYFRKLHDKYHLDTYEKKAEFAFRTKHALEQQRASDQRITDGTSLSHDEYMEVKERNFEARISTLKRGECLSAQENEKRKR